MGSYLLRNLLQRLALLFMVSVIAHAVVHLAPGEPSEVDPSNPRMKPEDVAKIRAAFHLNDPLHLQYVYWMRDLVTGELKSFKDSQPVLPKIWQRFLNSLPLFIGATLVVWTLSFPTGIRAALRRGSAYDRSTTFLAYALISIPGFFLSYLMILWVVLRFRNDDQVARDVI
jgi:peptide/nickel transport system permease protein